MIRSPEEIAAWAAQLQKDTEEARKTFGGWPDSGVQTYRVQFTSDSGAIRYEDVEAATGNAAAEIALGKSGGGKITNITPAPQQKQKARAA